jgi:hypothetical protein
MSARTADILTVEMSEKLRIMSLEVELNQQRFQTLNS